MALLTAVCAWAANTGGTRLEQLPRQWRDDQGQTLAIEDLVGQRVILTMAYARCHSICPATMSHLQRIQSLLDARGEQASIVVIGYESDQDSPASWRQYRGNRRLMRSNWHFLTGTGAAVRQLAWQLGFEFWLYDAHIMHDSRIVIFDSSGQMSTAVNPANINWNSLF